MSPGHKEQPRAQRCSCGEINDIGSVAADSSGVGKLGTALPHTLFTCTTTIPECSKFAGGGFSRPGHSGSALRLLETP
jgi:hypothetical protein